MIDSASAGQRAPARPIRTAAYNRSIPPGKQMSHEPPQAHTPIRVESARSNAVFGTIPRRQGRENHVLKVVRVAVVLLAAFCAGMPRQALAQSANASLLIEVRDSAGALLPDTTVLVINQDNGFSRRGTTSAQGTFSVERLPTGTYTLTASRPGYKVEVLNNIRLLTSIKAIVPITLAVGDVREQVEVTADGTTLRTGNSAVGAVYDSNTLLTLPSAEREPLEFATQAAGVAPAAPGSRLSTQGNTGVNSAGAREAANNYLLDGIDNNDLYLNRLVINPSLDSIEEFSILQNT